MAFVVTAPCFGCKHKECLQDCPTDSFHEGENMLYIDPDTCIDCDVCASVCPVEAIFLDENVPEQWRDFIELNAEMSQKTPLITAG
jgi:ferredoxin